MRQAPGRSGGWPVTKAQERLLVHYALDPGYVSRMSTVRAWEFPPAAVDLGALQVALRRVVARHDALRSTFDIQPVPHAVVRDGAVVRPEVYRDPTPGGAGSRQWITTQANRPFDIVHGPPLRCLVAVSRHRTLVALAAHHLVCDGRSFAVLVDELAAGYAGDPLDSGPRAVAQVHDTARAEARRRGSAEFAAVIDAWRGELAGLDPVELPADFPRPARPSGRGGTVRTPVPAPVAAGLRTIGGDRATPFMAGLAAYAALLARYTGSAVIPIGFPVANRLDEDSWRTVGYLANTVVAPVVVDGATSFRRLVDHCRDLVLDALDRQHVPFDEVVAALRPDRTVTLNPFYQVMFANETVPRLRLGTHPGTPVPIDRDLRVLDLSVTQVEDGNALTMLWQYDADLFERDTVAAMARSFLAIAADLTGRPDAAVRDAAVVHPVDRQRLIAWSGAHRGTVTTAEPAAATIVGAFTRAAASFPESVAVVDPQTRLSYAELAARTDAVAARLLAAGVRPGDLVGVSVTRSHRLPVAVLGIMKAGAAYVPLDPAYPGQLIRLMAGDAALRLVVVGEEVDPRDLPGTEVVRLSEAAAPAPGHVPLPEVRPGDAAYVIYTSGSTGTPKGVIISHDAVIAALEMWRAHYRLPFGGGRYPMVASSSFDQSVGELVRALCLGGELHICSDAELRDPTAFTAYLRRADPVMLDCVPAVLRLAAESADFDEALAAMSTRVLTLGGERWTMTEARRYLRGLPGVKLSNVYGLTECTVDSVGWEVDPDHPGSGMPIGTPLSNATVYLVDETGRLVPPGAVGELCIGGRSLALGYLGRPALTAERFRPDPVGPPGARIYRTGDHCRFRPDGVLEFVGRADRQVKLRGFRVEIGEVEAAIAACPGVEAVHVTVAAGQPANSVLVAYVVAEGDVALAPVRDRLPAHMVPTRVVRVDSLPRLANGKIDTAALAGYGDRLAPDDRVDLDDPFVRRIAQAWSRVLGVTITDPEASFFVDLGGTSLLAVQAVTEVRRATGRQVPFSALFDRPTLAGFAEACLTAPRN